MEKDSQENTTQELRKRIKNLRAALGRKSFQLPIPNSQLQIANRNIFDPKSNQN